ncbi:hypothetical protein [Bartonella grahamii]|nr:hypothetical protein [Bartonella grahamii]
MNKMPVSYKTIDEIMTQNPLCEAALSLRTTNSAKAVYHVVMLF